MERFSVRWDVADKLDGCGDDGDDSGVKVVLWRRVQQSQVMINDCSEAGLDEDEGDGGIGSSQKVEGGMV